MPRPLRNRGWRASQWDWTESLPHTTVAHFVCLIKQMGYNFAIWRWRLKNCAIFPPPAIRRTSRRRSAQQECCHGNVGSIKSSADHLHHPQSSRTVETATINNDNNTRLGSFEITNNFFRFDSCRESVPKPPLIDRLSLRLVNVVSLERHSHRTREVRNLFQLLKCARAPPPPLQATAIFSSSLRRLYTPSGFVVIVMFVT
jgi:hypothetical protein